MNGTIPFFDEFDGPGPGRPRLAGNVLVAIQDDPSVEWRVAAHADRNVPPVRVHDVEVVMVDVRPRFFSRHVADLSVTRFPHRPHDSRRATNQNKEQAGFGRMIREELSRRQVLKRPAMRIGCSSSRFSSDPYSDRHQFRNPPPPATPGKKR
jgi:hypothetical protein